MGGSELNLIRKMQPGWPRGRALLPSELGEQTTLPPLGEQTTLWFVDCRITSSGFCTEPVNGMGMLISCPAQLPFSVQIHLPTWPPKRATGCPVAFRLLSGTAAWHLVVGVLRGGCSSSGPLNQGTAAPRCMQERSECCLEGNRRTVSLPP